MAEAKSEPTKKVEPLHPSRMQEAQEVFRTWRAVAAAGTTLANMLEPDYWAHRARDLRPDDLVIARAEDGTFWALLLVLDAGTQYVKVTTLLERKTEAVEPSATVSVPDHTVEWSGPHTKWRVIRASDRKVLKDGFQSKADGYNWLASYGKVLAA